ncbi:DNA gyrase subunit A [Candidatus Saccharibacteria bacterium]|nr:DNA gyrase subunit A [Candidatus Saccharibacteria bacterium]
MMEDENKTSETPELEIIDETTEVMERGQAFDTVADGIELRKVEDVMEDSFLRYSMSVIIDRALPDVRDGLKPVHRRILFAMEKRGWKAPSKTVKSANIVGEVMAKYHPHGDSSIYDAMVRLAQPWSMRYTLVEGQGNFGSMDGDEAAAYRYTEARMDKIGAELLSDIDKETVDFRPNYEGNEMEPSVLPAAVPNLLLNGQMGIAVGMATNIPPHNLTEVIDATVELIDNPEATVKDLMKHVKGPDFPTGANVYGGAPMRQAYETGKGSVVMQAPAEIIEDKKGKFLIVFNEMPYGVSKEKLQEKIADLAKNKKLPSISAVRDESARGKVRFVVELKKDAFPKKVLNQLYSMTELQTSFHYNMLALIDGIQPRILGLRDILSEFVKHRQIVIRRRCEFDLKKARERSHILEGLKIALDHIDEVIATIRASKTTEDAKTALMSKFSLSEVQSLAILAMQLRRLTGLERQAIEDELAELRKLIAHLEELLADEQKILAVVKDALLAMRDKYGDKRRSRIFNHELGKFSEEDLVPEEESVVLMTVEGYIKRTLATDYQKQNRGGKGKRGITTKDEDVIDSVIPINSHEFLLFFTNSGRVFRLKAFEVPSAGLQAKGTAVVNLLNLRPDEKVTAIIKQCGTANGDANGCSGYLFMATKKGTIKKTAMKEYENIRSNGLATIKLDKGDELKWVQGTTGNNDIIMSTSAGQAVRFSEKDVRPMGRMAMGVRGIRLRAQDEIVGMDIIGGNEEKLLVVSRNGYGKLTDSSSFDTHKRGGVGIKAAVVTAKTGPLMDVQVIAPDVEEILLISTKGQAIRVAVKDIPKLGRATQGVRVMKLNDGDFVASVALMSKDEEPKA